MKTISIYILFLFFTITTVFAQVDRSKYPEPAPAPAINIGDAETFTLPNGLKVFVVENHKLPRVTFSLVLDRDPILEGAKAGYLDLVGPLMMSGTKTLNKDQLDEAIDQIGARINVGSASASASSLKKHQETLLKLFSDVLFNPSFPKDELDKLKKQSISGLAAEKDDPNSIASKVSNAVLYGKDHPYGEAATDGTVSAITVADIQGYYNTYFRPNIGYLAIVGDINKKEAETLVNKYFANWKKGSVPKHDWKPAILPNSNKVILVDRPSSVQSIVTVTYPVELQYNSPDRIASSLLSYVLGGGSSSRLFMNLRENKGYTYGAYSSINPDKISGAFEADASVRTEVTDSAAYQFYQELNRIADKTITDEELDAAKAYLTGSFGRSLESPSTIASFALNTEIQKLPKDYYKNYLKNLNAVTAADLNNIAPKYIKPNNSYLIIVGNTADFKDGVTQFGEVKNYTIEGDPEQKTAAINADVTAEKVIENYLNKIGGKDKLLSVKTIKQTGEGEIQGMKISQVAAIDKVKGVMVQRTFMGTQEISKMRVTKDKTTASAMGQEQEMPSEMHGALQDALLIFPELNYGQNVKISLDGIKKVNGKDAYKVIVENEGNKSNEYFDLASGLKVKTESSLTGEMEYSDYKDYGGIQFPSIITVKTPQLPMALKMVMTNIEVNPVLTDADLK